MKHGHSEKRLTHKDRKVHDHDGEMARMERQKGRFGPMDGGGKSERENYQEGPSQEQESYGDGK